MEAGPRVVRSRLVLLDRPLARLLHEHQRTSAWIALSSVSTFRADAFTF
jgi:hypothetical protein